MTGCFPSASWILTLFFPIWIKIFPHLFPRIFFYQRSSLVVERSLYAWEARVWFPTESNQRFQIEACLSNAWHIKGSSMQKLVDCCQNNATGRDIIRLCMWCDISVRQHYKVVIIPSVTSRHHPDMTWNVLKWKLNRLQKNHTSYVSCTSFIVNFCTCSSDICIQG